MERIKSRTLADGSVLDDSSGTHHAVDAGERYDCISRCSDAESGLTKSAESSSSCDTSRIIRGSNEQFRHAVLNLHKQIYRPISKKTSNTELKNSSIGILPSIE